MKLDKNEIVLLAKQVANANKKAPAAFRFEDKEYSFEALNDTLREQFQELAGTYNLYRKNKNEIFEIMQEVIDEVLPKKVLETYGMFAEVKQYGQGNKPQFTKKMGKQRAKQFITKVGLAGIYEVFKLDKGFYEIETTAFGGAAQIGLEEFLDGIVDFSSLTDIILMGLDDAVYTEIAKALTSVYSQLPGANTHSAANFSETEFDKLIAIARAYGTPVIYTSLEFATTLVPAADWRSNEIKNEMYDQGYVGSHKGTKVIVLPNSFTDETNVTKVLDTSFAYIIPTSATDKPVKIAMEGETIIDEYVNYDRSREIQAYKKFGVGIVANNDICIYENTAV